MPHIKLDTLAEAIQAADARIQDDWRSAKDLKEQRRGVRRTAAHIAYFLPENMRVQFLKDCGYG